MNLLRKIFGIQNDRQRPKSSEFSRFIHDSSTTRKRRIIEEVVKEANKDQRELVQRVERMKSLKSTN